MGNLDRLLEALARKLPRSADRASIVAALHEAAKALPENQAKTRKRLVSNEQDCIEKLEALLKKLPAEAHEDAASEAAPDEAQDDSAVAAYAGISEDDPAACVARCAELVQGALAGLRPAKLAEDAFEGLLGVLPAGKIAMDLDSFRLCMQLLPTASAALGCSEPPAWCRFLGFLLSALARLKGVKTSLSAQKDAKDVAARLGGLIALSSEHASARAVLRHGLSALDEVLSSEVMTRLVQAVLPIMGVAFSGVSAWEDAPVVRSDLVAVLHALRFVGLCRKAGAGEMRALNEASDMLRFALEKHFDATTISSKLQSMGLNASKRKRLANGRADAARFVSETLLAASPPLSAASIADIVSSSGLPIGEGEEVHDKKAAAARARGDLFFEDVSGGDLKEASAQMAANVLVKLDGIEDLITTPKKKKKAKKAAANEEA